MPRPVGRADRGRRAHGHRRGRDLSAVAPARPRPHRRGARDAGGEGRPAPSRRPTRTRRRSGSRRPATRSPRFPTTPRPRRVLFATAEPAYLDKTNATTIHAALGLPQSVAAYDVGGRCAPRSARCGSPTTPREPTLVVHGGRPHRAARWCRRARRRRRRGPRSWSRPTSTATRTRTLGWGSSSLEFLDRWRLPAATRSRQWEERFGEHAYVPLACDAFADALKAADVDRRRARPRRRHRRAHPRAARTVARAIGVAPDALVDDLASTVGNTGAAPRGSPARRRARTRRAGAADRACSRSPTAPTPSCCETTGRARAARPRRARSRSRSPDGRALDSYETFLTWRGFLDREPPRRPDPEAPAAPPSLRQRGLEVRRSPARACEACGERPPPARRACALGAVRSTA